MFLDINQNGDMEFPSMTVYLSLLVADGDVLLDTQDTSILIINSMTFHVSLQMELWAEDLPPQSTFIFILMCLFR